MFNTKDPSSDFFAFLDIGVGLIGRFKIISVASVKQSKKAIMFYLILLPHDSGVTLSVQ